MPLRAAAVCGLLAPVTFVVGLVAGDLSQPDAFSPVDDNISDLGALTAESPWLYNQVAANLTGLLVLVFALGLWGALGGSLTARLGVILLALVGVGMFLDGLFRLDCRGIDAGCDNTSWHSTVHGKESVVTAICLYLAPFALAFAFRRLVTWHGIWLPTLLATPAVLAVSAAFSVLGPGAASRAGAITWFLWLGFVALHALRLARGSRVRTAA